MIGEIAAALMAAGYGHMPPTRESLIECFLDYVASGYYGDLDYTDALEMVELGELADREIIRALGIAVRYHKSKEM